MAQPTNELHNLIGVIAAIVVIAAAISAWTFCLLYHYTSPWWQRGLGRNIMSMMICLAEVCTWAAVRTLTNVEINPWFDIIRILVYGQVVCVVIWRLVILWRAQHPYRVTGTGYTEEEDSDGHGLRRPTPPSGM